MRVLAGKGLVEMPELILMNQKMLSVRKFPFGVVTPKCWT